MSINVDEILKDGYLPTSSDKYFINEEYSMIFRDPEFKILGFIDNFMYVYTDNYVSKYTDNGKLISKIRLEIQHGTFDRNVSYMYLFCDKTVYKVSKNLDIEWEITLDDYIRFIKMDTVGNLFILFQNSRNILKYNKDGKQIMMLNVSDDTNTKIYRIYISEGRSIMYIIGSTFKNNSCECFVHKYNLYKCILMETMTLCTIPNVLPNDETYEFTDIFVKGEYIYLKTKDTIQRVNLKLQPSWKMLMGYNEISKSFNKLTEMEYDDSSYRDNFIYFCEDLYDTYGYSYGKMTLDGNVLWKLTSKENDFDIGFNIAIHDDYIYAYNRESIQAYIPSVLAVNNNGVLFETRDNKLIKLYENNHEILNSDYFDAKRLFADYLNSSEPEELYIPLWWENGPIVNEDNKNLVFKDKNKNYAVNENYMVQRLISDIVDDANYTKSRVKSHNGYFITTKNGNRIRTKKPYKIDLTYDVFVTKKNAEPIVTTDSRDSIISKHGKPRVYYGLLADFFKFYTVLMTKRDHKLLITKKDKDYLCTLTTKVYKYFMKKLKDINILVEYIIKNNVLDSMYPNYVELLKHHTYSVLNDIQKSKCPCYYDLRAIKTNKYTYDGFELEITENYVSIFSSKNLPFIKKKEYQPLDIRSLASMVADETIYPFLLFINGRCIKWSDITIIRDWHESYIMIENMNDDTVYSEDIKCILYPCSVRYGEDTNIHENDETGLYFTEDGLYTTNTEKINIRMEVLDPNVISTTQRINKDKSYIEFDLDKGKLSTEYNIFTFDNAKFYSDGRYFLKNTGYNIYGYSKDSINAVFKTFYYIEGLESKNMIFKIPNSEHVKEDAINMVTGKGSKEYLSTLNHNFDFTFSRNKTYARNIAEAIDYISSYDVSLLMNYYKKKSNIEAVAYTGEEVQEKAKNGFLIVPRYRKTNLDDHIIVFKNGILYDQYANIQSTHKLFKIPIAGFLDNDILEVIHFKNVHNTVYDITVNFEGETVMIPEVLRYDNFKLFSSDLKLISFSYKNNFVNGLYKNSDFKFNNTDYYTKKSKLVCKRQFHHQTFKNINTKTLTLSSDFKYAQDTYQFAIFVDGKHICASEWSIYTKNNNLLINIPSISKICTVDVFFLPDICDEITSNRYVTKLGMGDVTIDDYLDVPFDKDVFFIYCDGIKVPVSRIQNIDKDSFRLFDKEDVIDKLCVCKAIQSDEIMKELISYHELWSDATQTLDKEIYERLFK